MKICLLLSTFAYDGIKRSVVHFANAMHDLGHETWVGVLHEWPGRVSLRSELRIPQERVVSWDGLGQGRREWAMWRFFRRGRFDVVHASTVKMNHVGRWTALAARVPCVIASEDNLCLNRSWKTRFEDRLLAKWGHGVVMISKAVAESFIEVEDLPREKTHTVYYGLPLEGFAALRKTREQLDAKRAELGVPAGPTVVCASRLHFSKSLDTLVHAARRVVDKLPAAQFILAGDGDERPKLEALRDHLKLQSSFHFIGAREDIYEVLQLADVVTLCSLWEGLGFTLMEAMALGKPVVGTDVTGINEIIENGRNGLLVTRESPDLLADALRRVLTDASFAGMMGREGPKVIAEKFDVKKNAQQLIALYERVLKGSASSSTA